MCACTLISPTAAKAVGLRRAADPLVFQRLLDRQRPLRPPGEAPRASRDPIDSPPRAHRESG